MEEKGRPTYRAWLIIFAIVFLVGLTGVFGLRAIISIVIRYPEALKTELRTVIQTGITTLLDAVLLVAVVVLATRSTVKGSTYKIWLLVIAAFFALKFALGLIADVRIYGILSPHSITASAFRGEYFRLIVSSIITLIYGGLAVVAVALSRRVAVPSRGMG